MVEDIVNKSGEFAEFEKARTVDSVLVWTRLDYLKDELKRLRTKFETFENTIVEEMEMKWKEFKKSMKRGLKKDEKFKQMNAYIGTLRQEILSRLTDELFNDLWNYRANVELLIATFRYGLVSDYVARDLKWEEKISSSQKPIVLRMGRPRKNDMRSFKITEEIRKMFKPLHEVFEESRNILKKQPTPQRILLLEKEIIEKANDVKIAHELLEPIIYEYSDQKLQKRIQSTYKSLYKLREQSTLITQACAPRI